MSASITTGEDAVISHELLKNGLPFVISGVAVITCRIITPNHESMTEAILQPESNAGSNWAESVVGVILPSDAAASISASWNKGRTPAKLETQVHDNGVKQTWFQSIDVIKGTIS